ncbi:UPF0500 protein C1orf216 homolog [Bombina bombina]|uniref:UPF0500 protein C1orf216 homolog n=1 Tax=Bombina bombina TaxID=8345 RepID=UPI00235AD664|nr:UPF0500 protein C1orf216 homolog [Bombina bombina]XP_053562978.1 UPF0500 protein C1orf216 homolog [Bombina bombina]
MFALQKPEATPHQSPFHDVKPMASLTFPIPSDKERKQDTNFNILEEAYDKNENWRQVKSLGDEEEEKIKAEDNKTSLEDNRTLMKKRAMEQMKTARSEGISVSSSEEEVRSPPEGAEIMQLGEDNLTEDTEKECDAWVGSPLEDIGYASSSLSIDSPDSISGKIFEDTNAPVQTETPQNDPETEDSEAESSSDSDTLSITLSEAFQSLQDKERLKEQEKEKHHVQLTMYRRLALLRWIRCLQQRVKDQQNRLQESFDTILDNRKEFLRCMQHGCNKTSSKEAA